MSGKQKDQISTVVISTSDSTTEPLVVKEEPIAKRREPPNANSFSQHCNSLKLVLLFFVIFSIITGSFALHEHQQRTKAHHELETEKESLKVETNHVTLLMQQNESLNGRLRDLQQQFEGMERTESEEAIAKREEIESQFKKMKEEAGGSLNLRQKSQNRINRNGAMESYKWDQPLVECPNDLQARIYECENQNKHALVWQCNDDVCGGIGDRFKGWANLRLLALDLCVPFRTQWLGLDQVWDNRRENQKFTLADDDGFFNDVSKTEFYNNMTFQRKITSELSDHNLRIKSNIGIGQIDNRLSKLEWATLSDDDIAEVEGCFFNEFFQLSQPFQNTLNQDLQQLLEAKQGYEHIIAIHFRMGDAMSNMREWGTPTFHGDKRHTVGQADEMIKCAQELETTIFQSSSNALFLFFSDSEDAKNRVKGAYENVYVTSVSPHHVERRKMTDAEERTQRFRAAQLSSWTEIILMSYAEALVTSGGGFPHVAIAIAGIPKERVLLCKMSCAGSPLCAKS